MEINVLSMPVGASYRVAKTVANGNWFFGNATALSLGLNTVSVAAVSFDRSVKFQFSSGDVEFDLLTVNAEETELRKRPRRCAHGQLRRF